MVMNNEELNRLKPFGARIVEHVEGWQATILLREGEHGKVHEETFPLRATRSLALDDVEHVMPGVFAASMVRVCRQQQQSFAAE